MRRPHPRFDRVRNAWVTRAGGKLKLLAKGPQTAESEAEAWNAFYAHMASLGNPAPVLPTSISLGEVADEFAASLKREIAAGRRQPATLAYYTRFIQRFIDTIGGRRPASSVKPIELDRWKTGWHSVQAIQRLYIFWCFVA